MATLVIIPTLTAVGYVHFKKSGSFKAEADIGVEANPHFHRLIKTTEITLPLYIEILDLLTKLSLDQKLSDEEIKRISEVKVNVKDYMTKKTLK